MRYLSTKDMQALPMDWNRSIDTIQTAVRCLATEDYVQPVKPYLRYRDARNRIIAMPAFIGGDINSAGIKWIASFPGNIDRDLPRASSVLVLNEVDTGVPKAIFNGGLLSAIRTASVSGLMIREYQQARRLRDIRVGMTGFGPIGRQHLAMIAELLGDNVRSVRIFDPRPVDRTILPAAIADRVEIVPSWRAAYADAQIFLTCTVASERYIDQAPVKGSLQLNVSLRDYTADVLRAIDVHVVDNWDEICRENTDIELAHKTFGLSAKDVYTIDQVITRKLFAQAGINKTIMVNPMGMAIFDMAIAEYFLATARRVGAGVELD